MNAYRVMLAWSELSKIKQKQKYMRRRKKRKKSGDALCSFTFRNFYRHIQSLLQLFSFTAIRFNRLPCFSPPAPPLPPPMRSVSITERERADRDKDLSRVRLVQFRDRCRKKHSILSSVFWPREQNMVRLINRSSFSCLILWYNLILPDSGI